MKRTDIKSLDIFDSANGLDTKVVDKSYARRSESKKNRRNRHYVNNILKHTIDHENESFFSELELA